MSYIALYRKYRPVTFDEVVGQKHIVATIKSAIENEKVAHAYLLCGPRGTGKTTVARILAKAVNCTGDKKPCGVCENCLQIQAGNHPDIVEIDAASNNGVDEIRGLVEKVKYAPLAARHKVYIIDEVHMLTQSAFNALLKTLEDPPSHVLFILATTEVHKVIATIISRCQRFDFAKVNITSLIEKMQEIIDKEEIEYEDGLLEEIAILAEGGMRDALSILDQLVAFCQGYLDTASLRKVYGLLSTSEKISLIENVLEQNIGETLAILEKVNTQGLDIRRLTNEMTEIIKECIVYNLTKNSQLLIKCSEQEANRVIEKVENKHLFELVDLLMESAEKYRNASNANLYFETCLLKALTINTKEKAVIEKPIVKEEPRQSQSIEHKEKAIDKVEVTSDVELSPKEQGDIETVGSENIAEEFLLSLLLRANREERNELTKLWHELDSLNYDENYVELINALKQCEAFAVGEDFIIVDSNDKEAISCILEHKNIDSGILLMKEFTKKARQIFAIDTIRGEELKENFRKLKFRTIPLKAANALNFSHLFSEEKQESKLYEVFGKDGIEVVE